MDLRQFPLEYYQRLLFADCRKPTVDALKYEGAGALVFGFSIIGQVAARELMNNPKTQAGMAAMSAAVDKEKLADKIEDDDKETIKDALKDAQEWLSSNEDAEKDDFEEKLKAL